MIDARKALAASRKSFISIGIFSFFINLAMLAVPLYTLQLFDRVLSSQSMDTLILLSIAVALALLLLGSLEVLRSRIMVRISVWLDRVLGPELLSVSIRSAPMMPGQSNLQTLRDLSSLRSFVAGAGVFHLFDSPWVPIYVLVIFAMHPALGWIALLGAIILAGLALINEASTRKPLADANAIAIQVQNNVEANARNAEVIEALGMLKPVVQQWQEQSRHTLALQTVASDRAGLLTGMTKVFRLSLQVAIMGVGVYLAIQQIITPGIMIAASIILGRALAPVEQMIGTWKGFVGAREAYHRINKLLSQNLAQRGNTTLPRPDGHLSCTNVTYLPPGQTSPTLQGVTFELAAGESLGIIGPSAAGKSTLARLLVGVWQPRIGNVRLDGADVYQWERDSFGKYVGYLPQDIELFDGTIKQNIARMDPEAQDEAIIAAAKMADCHEMILKLPNGYDTRIGTGAHTLSGGQRQRLGLARAFFGDVRFLVLDEPNASLDSEGEEALLAALDKAKQLGITTAIICHRPSLLSQVDKLLMLQSGRMVTFGPRDEIMGKVTNQGTTAPVTASAQASA